MSQAGSETGNSHQLTQSPPIHIPDSFEGYPISSFCLQHVPACDLDSVLIPGGLVRDRIERLGFDISSDFANQDFTFLCVLKGGFQFFNQLLEVVRQYHRFNGEQSLEHNEAGKARRIQAEFIRLVSYEDDASKGDVKIIGLESLSSLRDKNVLIVEDIIDSGLTMKTLLKALEREQPRLVKVAALFFKRTAKNKGNYYPDCEYLPIDGWRTDFTADLMLSQTNHPPYGLRKMWDSPFRTRSSWAAISITTTTFATYR